MHEEVPQSEILFLSLRGNDGGKSGHKFRYWLKTDSVLHVVQRFPSSVRARWPVSLSVGYQRAQPVPLSRSAGNRAMLSAVPACQANVILVPGAGFSSRHS